MKCTRYARISYKDARDMGIDRICDTVNGILDGDVRLTHQDDDEALQILADTAFILATEQNLANLERLGNTSAFVFDCYYDESRNPIPFGYTFFLDVSEALRAMGDDEFGDVDEVKFGVFAADNGDL